MKKLYTVIRVLLSISLALMIFLSFSCEKKKEITIGFVMKTLSNPFFIQMKEGAENEAKRHKDIKLEIQATQEETDIEQQRQIIETMITKGVEAICITPNDSKGIVPVIVKANKKRIPVAIVDTKVDSDELSKQGGQIATFIGSDNVQGGMLAADGLAAALGGKGKIVILEGVPGQETAISRKEGFLTKIAEYPGIKAVASQSAYWTREEAYSVAQTLLTGHPDLNGIFASNDEMALGAARAVQDAGKKVVIIGFDFTPDGKAAIKNGLIYGSVAQFPSEMGRIAVLSVVRLAKGETVPNDQPTKVRLMTAKDITE